MPEKPSVKMPGTVEKIIQPAHPGQPEKAQISVEGADDLYREIRIENLRKRQLLRARERIDVRSRGNRLNHRKRNRGEWS